MQDFVITFGTDLSTEQLKKIEEEWQIPADFGNFYVKARSPYHAMRLFREEKKIERKIVLARNFDVVRSIYIVRNLTNPKKSYKEFRVVGLIWNEEFTNLMPGNKRK